MSTGTATADPPAPNTVAGWYAIASAKDAAVTADQSKLAADQAAATIDHQGLNDSVAAYGGMPVVQVDMSDPANPRAVVFMLQPDKTVRVIAAAIATDPIPIPASIPVPPAAPTGDGTAPASAAT